MELQMTKANPLPSQEQLHELFDYSIVEGSFYWRKSGTGRKMDKPAGHLEGMGYVRITVDGAHYLAHRLAWVYITGEDPGELSVDHENGDKANNAFHNLQLLTHQQNVTRRHKPETGSSKYRGVSKAPSGRWRARLKHDGVLRHLGTFDREKDAAYVAYLYSHFVYHVGYSNYRMPT